MRAAKPVVTVLSAEGQVVLPEAVRERRRAAVLGAAPAVVSS